MIYLSEKAQNIRESVLHGLFCVTTFLNLVSLYCLITQTPPNQAKIRNFLLYMQIMVISIGIYTDLLMLPIPLMPAMAALCTGILCRALPLPTVLAGLLLLYVWLAAGIGFCILFRHQTLLAQNGKLSKWEMRLLIFTGLFCSVVPTCAFAVWPFDFSDNDELMITSPYKLGWAIERGAHAIVARSDTILFFISAIVTMIPCAFVGYCCIFLHMHYVLHRDTTHSKSSIHKIRRPLRVLLIQLLVPFVMIAFPATIMFFSMLCECISFEVNLSLFGITACHPLVHNLILLGITPTYRERIAGLLRRQNNVKSLTKTAPPLWEVQRRATSR